MSIYRKPSKLRDLLSHYKLGWDRYDPEARSALAEILSAYWARSKSELTNRFNTWNAVQVVPSTKGALRSDLRELVTEVGLPIIDLLYWSGKPALHRNYDANLYRVVPAQQRRRVLIIEDAYVSGSRSQSAAAALRLAGHEIAGIVTLGRRVNPEFDEVSAQYWATCATAASKALTGLRGGE